MDSKIYIPHPALQHYIAHYVVVEVGVQNAWSTVAVAPPGRCVLGVVVGDKKILCKDGEAPSDKELLSITGQLTNFKETKFFGLQTLVYAILMPCGAYRLLGVGQHNCVNRSSNLLDLLPVKERSILQQFEDCQNPQKTLFMLEGLLLRLLLQQKEKHHLARITSISEYLMQHSHEPLLIKKICRETGFSKSALERQFLEYIGIGPKQYHRIVRFNNALRHISQHKEFRHWTEVVYQFGYYDQSHFIKEFKLFYGKTPSAFSTNDGYLSNIVK